LILTTLQKRPYLLDYRSDILFYFVDVADKLCPTFTTAASTDSAKPPSVNHMSRFP